MRILLWAVPVVVFSLMLRLLLVQGRKKKAQLLRQQQQQHQHSFHDDDDDDDDVPSNDNNIDWNEVHADGVADSDFRTSMAVVYRNKKSTGPVDLDDEYDHYMVEQQQLHTSLPQII